MHFCQLDQGCVAQRLNPVLPGVDVSEFAFLHGSSGKRQRGLIIDLDLDRCLERDPELIAHV